MQLFCGEDHSVGLVQSAAQALSISNIWPGSAYASSCEAASVAWWESQLEWFEGSPIIKTYTETYTTFTLLGPVSEACGGSVTYAVGILGYAQLLTD